MEFKRWENYCLCATEADIAFPPEAQSVSAPFSPLIFLIRRDGACNRGFFAISALSQLEEKEDISLLLPTCEQENRNPLAAFVREHGAGVLNVRFTRAFSYLKAEKKKKELRVQLVGLGDVGGSLLTALKLLGKELAEIAVYDPNAALCKRYEMELGQVLSVDGEPLPEIRICREEELFDCDLFLFCASRGVPAVGSQILDVRMAQFEQNRQMLCAYAKKARERGFLGLFCQISDPVDQLSRAVFLQSNTDEKGIFDGGGLLPEQVQGFGLGVMAARVAYYAKKLGADFSKGRVYGPHGAQLLVANHPTKYDEALSTKLTELTVHANLQIRDLGFKPYIAPAISSAAVSILRLLRGWEHFGAVPMGKAYFGCRSRMTPLGLSITREPLHPVLIQKLSTVHRSLEAFSYD